MKKRIMSLVLAIALVLSVLPCTPAAAAAKSFYERNQELLDTDFYGYGKLAWAYFFVTDTTKQHSDEICAGKNTDLEKVTAIHDWITENIYYDYPNLEYEGKMFELKENVTPDEIYNSRKGVCEQYAVLFQAFCVAQNIPCVYVSGSVSTCNINHAWNLVRVNGQWSWVDCTWDTYNAYRGGDVWEKGDTRKDYFMVSTEQISKDHGAGTGLLFTPNSPLGNFTPGVNYKDEYYQILNNVCYGADYYNFGSGYTISACTAEEMIEAGKVRAEYGLTPYVRTDIADFWEKAEALAPDLYHHDADGFYYAGNTLARYTGGAEDIAVPDGVTYLGDTVFYASKYRTLTIPLSVTKVHVNAFIFNSRGIRDIYYEGSEAQWNDLLANSVAGNGETVHGLSSVTVHFGSKAPGLTPNPSDPPVIDYSIGLPKGKQGQPYSFKLTAKKGVNVKWRMDSGFPAGLTLSEDGVISGTPTESGLFYIYFYASTAGGEVSGHYGLQIEEAIPGLPKIVSHPEDAKTKNYGPTYSVSAMGNNLHYQWWGQKTGGQPMKLGTDKGWCLLTDAEREALAPEAEVWCEVSNEKGSVLTNRARLTVLPSDDEKKEDEKKEETASAGFTVPTTIVSTGVNPSVGGGTSYASTQTVMVDGKLTIFQMYALKDPVTGYPTNYVKLRDVAYILNGTPAQFNVDYDLTKNEIIVRTRSAYTTQNGQEMQTPYTGDQPYAKRSATTNVDGTALDLQAFTLQSGSYTYYKLRDLGQALGFNVGYDLSTDKVFIQTDKLYTDAD